MALLRSAADEQRLRACVGDLVAISTMSALWIGQSVDATATSLRDLLVRMLRADEASVELRGEAIDMLVAPSTNGVVPRGGGNAFTIDDADAAVRRTVVPIGLGGELGRFVVSSRRSDFPDELELLALKVTANQVAVAFRYAALLRRHEQTEARLRARASQQAVVARLGQRALDGISLDDAFVETTIALRDTLGMDASEILELIDGESSLRFRSGRGWGEQLPAGIRIGEGHDHECGYALRSPGPTIVHDARTETRFGTSAAMRDGGFVSGALIVIATPNGPFGLLGVHSREPRPLTEDDVHFQQALANLVAAAVGRERADLERRELLARMVAGQEAAEQASRAKSEFLGMMSHELRTALGAIGGYAQLMEEKVYGPVNDEQRAALGRIQRGQQYLLGLINSVLGFLKLGSGQVHYDITDVLLGRTLDAVEELIRPQMDVKGVRFASRPPDEEVRVRADAEKLQQIVLNLLSNATKFTEPGGDIRLECEVGEREVGIYVTDTGCGIPADKLATVFQPFVQVNSRSSASHQGTGLGLAISRDLAVGMGGRLEAHSEVGKGSTFIVTVPRTA